MKSFRLKVLHGRALDGGVDREPHLVSASGYLDLASRIYRRLVKSWAGQVKQQ